jgi:CHAT domain-containing protein/Tfp pilus assembly protein PilF
VTQRLTKLLLAVCLLFVADAQDSAHLSVRQPVNRELGPRRTDSFIIEAKAGQFAHLVARQNGVDVVVTVVDPAGKTVISADSPNSAFGTEPASFLAAANGSYMVKISKAPRSTETGHYELELLDLRTPTDADRTLIQAQAKLYAAGAKEPSDQRASVQLYGEAEALWRRVHDSYEEGLCHLRIGLAQYADADYQKALATFQQSVAMARRAGDASLEADAQWRAAHAQYMLHEFAKAADLYQQALTLKHKVGDRAAEAMILTDTGAAYSAMFDHPKARGYYEQALALARTTGDRKAQATGLLNMGTAYAQTGDQDKAIECYEQALSAFRTFGDQSAEATTLLDIGAIYQGRGESPKALEYFERVLPIKRTAKDRDGEAATLVNIANVYRDLGASEESLDFYRRALSLGQTRFEASALMGMGDIFFFLGDKEKAAGHYEESLKLERAQGNQQGEALALIGLANVYCDLGGKQKRDDPVPAEDVKKALDTYEKALASGRANNDYFVQMCALMGAGVSYSMLGDRAKAVQYFNQANFFFGIAQFQPGQGWAKYEIARVERDKGEYAGARAHAAEVREMVESLRAKVLSPELRASFFAAVDDCYGLEIDVLMKMHAADPAKNYQAEALKISERQRARVLLEALAEGHAGIREGVDPALLERQRNLQIQLNAKETARMQTLGTPSAEQLLPGIQKELSDLSTQYEEVNAQIRARSPKYAALRFPQPLTVAEIQKEVLDSDTLLIEYAMGDPSSYLWVVSNEKVASVTLARRNEIEKVARAYHDALTKSDGSAAIAAGQSLSRLLLAGLGDSLGKKRLVVVADGALQYIPFAALPDPADPAQPLVVNHEIVNLPSASTVAVLRNENRDRKPAPKLLAVFADPVFSRDDSRLTGTQTTQAARMRDAGEPLQRAMSDLGMSGPRLFRLPGTRREAASILALVPADQRKEALDFDASRETILAPDISDYRVLHLATHGLLNSVHPQLSGIVLSLVDRRGQPKDGFLRLNEIYNLKLSADLVVLSACQTALGKEIHGEGLVGLTRGFMYAGAPAVMASLWKVDDRATAELMKRFYSGMLGEAALRPAAALRAAQVAMWKTRAFEAPYYWAAFTLQGEWH